MRTALPDRWDSIRREVYRRAGHRCEACGSNGGGRPLHAHELWQRFERGRQVLTHLACYCDVCHAATHLGRTLNFSGSEEAAREALQHLATVNGWTVPQAARYAQQELAVCAERSRHKWTLDISLLEREFEVKLPSAVSRGGGNGWLGKLLGAGR